MRSGIGQTKKNFKSLLNRHYNRHLARYAKNGYSASQGNLQRLIGLLKTPTCGVNASPFVIATYGTNTSHSSRLARLAYGAFLNSPQNIGLSTSREVQLRLKKYVIAGLTRQSRIICISQLGKTSTSCIIFDLNRNKWEITIIAIDRRNRERAISSTLYEFRLATIGFQFDGGFLILGQNLVFFCSPQRYGTHCYPIPPLCSLPLSLYWQCRHSTSEQREACRVLGLAIRRLDISLCYSDMARIDYCCCVLQLVLAFFNSFAIWTSVSVMNSCSSISLLSRSNN